VAPSDVEIFYAQQCDAAGIRMAAFVAKDPLEWEAFRARWQRILADRSMLARTIVCDDQVAGTIAKFERNGEPEVTYWLGKEFWSRGIATEALRQLLTIVKVRPLYGRAVSDNAGSRRVLEKCGFVQCGCEVEFAAARDEQVEEIVFVLRT
jgi:RimJ/RimL family protein N-acetyltransferase